MVEGSHGQGGQKGGAAPGLDHQPPASGQHRGEEPVGHAHPAPGPFPQLLQGGVGQGRGPGGQGGIAPEVARRPPRGQGQGAGAQHLDTGVSEATAPATASKARASPSAATPATGTPPSRPAAALSPGPPVGAPHHQRAHRRLPARGGHRCPTRPRRGHPAVGAGQPQGHPPLPGRCPPARRPPPSGGPPGARRRPRRDRPSPTRQTRRRCAGGRRPPGASHPRGDPPRRRRGPTGPGAPGPSPAPGPGRPGAGRLQSTPGRRGRPTPGRRRRAGWPPPWATCPGDLGHHHPLQGHAQLGCGQQSGRGQAHPRHPRPCRRGGRAQGQSQGGGARACLHGDGRSPAQAPSGKRGARGASTARSCSPARATGRAHSPARRRASVSTGRASAIPATVTNWCSLPLPRDHLVLPPSTP